MVFQKTVPPALGGHRVSQLTKPHLLLSSPCPPLGWVNWEIQGKKKRKKKNNYNKNKQTKKKVCTFFFSWAERKGAPARQQQTLQIILDSCVVVEDNLCPARFTVAGNEPTLSPLIRK